MRMINKDISLSIKNGDTVTSFSCFTFTRDIFRNRQDVFHYANG